MVIHVFDTGSGGGGGGVVTQGTIPWVVAPHGSANPWPISGAVTVSGTVAVTQNTSPWVVSGTVTANQGTSPWVVSGTVIANQGTSPWTVDGTVNAAQSGAWTVAATQSGAWTVAATQSGAWTVSASQAGPWNVGADLRVLGLPVDNSNPVPIHDAGGSITVDQGTSPWVVSGTVTANQGTSPWVVSGTVTVGGTVAVTQSTSPWVVSGTVTANQGTSPWVVSGTVAATQSGAWSVSITGTVPLPTGAATLAEQQTQTTSLQLIDDAINAPNTAVSKVAAIGAQMYYSGTVAATENNVSALRIDTNRALHVQLRSGAAETGVLAAPLRVDPTGTTTQPISAAALPLPAGAATAANQATEITSLQAIDDLPHATNPQALQSYAVLGAQLDDTSPATPSENQVAALRMTAARGLHACLRNTAGTETGTSTTPLRTDPTGTTTQPVSGTVTANQGTKLGSGSGWRVTEYGHTNGFPNLYAAVAGIVEIPCGVIADPVSATTAFVAATGGLFVTGDVANDGVDAGNPVKVGGRASAALTVPTAVSADGDRVAAWLDRSGRRMTIGEPVRSTITQVFTAQVFNNTTTAANSTSFDASRYRSALVYVDLARANAPTDIRLIVQMDRGSGNWFDYLIDQWVDMRFIPGQMPFTQVLPLNFPPGATLRVRAVATGTTASATFTLSCWIEGIS